MKKVERAVKKFMEERCWNISRPADLAKSISIEAGELLELFQWINPEIEEIKKNEEKTKEIEKELADIFIYALNMSNTLGLNPEKIILEKLNFQAKKYPAAVFKNKKMKGLKTDDIYYSIKKKYRRAGF